MPTARPRIAVTLTPEQDRLLRRLKQLNGLSMSEIVGDLLDASLPVLERTATVLEAAARLPTESRAALRQRLETAEASLLPALQSLTDQAVADWTEFAAEVAEAASAHSAPPAPNPRPSNTGVTPPKTKRSRGFPDA